MSASSVLSHLFTARPPDSRKNRFGPAEIAVLTLYSAILAFAVAQHRPWCDEAQAWLLARDSTLGDLLLQRMHYEGAPGLWPLILWIATRLHLPFAALNWLGASFAVAGVAILLRFAPFPRIFRWLLPFSFFLQYQYAVIARPYVLVAPLLFLLAIAFTLRRPRPVLFAVVAGLLANISLHTAIVACIFTLIYLHRLRKAVAGPDPSPARPRLLPAAIVFTVFLVCAGVVAFPAPDAGLAGKPGKPLLPPNPYLLRLMPPQQLPPGAPPLDSPIEQPTPHPIPGGFGGLIVRIGIAIVFTADALCFPVAESNLLAVPFLALLLLWLRRRQATVLLLPALLAAGASSFIWVYDHHTGIFLLALIAAVWITLDSPGPSPAPPCRLSPGLAFTAVAFFALIPQLGWSAHAILAERTMAYDPGRQTADYLAQHFAGKRVAGFAFETVSTQPYATHSLFFNQPHAFWLWSVPVLIDRRRTEALAQHPDAVVLADFVSGTVSLHNQWVPLAPAGQHPYRPMLAFWQAHGYHVTQSFCGERVFREGIANTLCEDILIPSQASDARTLTAPVR